MTTLKQAQEQAKKLMAILTMLLSLAWLAACSFDPAPCGVLARITQQKLAEHGISSRMLAVEYEDGGAHAFVIYRGNAGEYFSWDNRGQQQHAFLPSDAFSVACQLTPCRAVKRAYWTDAEF